MTLVRWVAPVLLVFVAGCATDKDGVEKQLSKLKEEVARLQSDTDRMGERVDAMEAQKATTQRSDDHAATGPQMTTVSRPKLKIVHLEPGTELAAPDDADADSTASESDNAPRVVIQGEGKSLETRTMPAAPSAAKTAPAPAKKTSKTDQGDAKTAQPEAAPSK